MKTKFQISSFFKRRCLYKYLRNSKFLWYFRFSGYFTIVYFFIHIAFTNKKYVYSMKAFHFYMPIIGNIPSHIITCVQSPVVSNYLKGERESNNAIITISTLLEITSTNLDFKKGGTYN